jgi:hypothetical protein
MVLHHESLKDQGSLLCVKEFNHKFLVKNFLISFLLIKIFFLVHLFYTVDRGEAGNCGLCTG